MPVISVLEIQLKPESVEEAKAIFGRALVDTRAFEGNVSVDVLQDREDPARLVAVEVWESLEADDAYRAWRAGEGALTDLVPHLAGAPKLTVGEQIEI